MSQGSYQEAAIDCLKQIGSGHMKHVAIATAALYERREVSESGSTLTGADSNALVEIGLASNSCDLN